MGYAKWTHIQWKWRGHSCRYGILRRPNGRENMERLEVRGREKMKKRSVESHIMYGADASYMRIVVPIWKLDRVVFSPPRNQWQSYQALVGWSPIGIAGRWGWRLRRDERVQGLATGVR